MPTFKALTLSSLLGIANANIGSKLGVGMDHDGTMMHAASGSFGTGLTREFTRYNDLPMGAEALNNDRDWEKLPGNCDPDYGYAWTQKRRFGRKGPARSTPLILYTTESGAPSGMGTYMRGGEALYEGNKKWAMASGSALANVIVEDLEDDDWKMNKDFYIVNIAFRIGDVCTGSNFGGVGETLILNKGAADSKVLPITAAESESQGWLRGSCFDGMGWHRFLNTGRDKSFPWNGKDFFPIVTMFDDAGRLNAVFFTAATGQLDIPMIKTNHWEPKNLDHSEMCQNLCSPGCGFKNAYNDEWSTMHIYFQDVDSIKCNAESYTPPMQCTNLLGQEWACCEQNALNLASEAEPAPLPHTRLFGAIGFVALLAGASFAFAVFSKRQATQVPEAEMSGHLQTES